MLRPASPSQRKRAAAWSALLLGVVLAHGLLLDRVLLSRLGEGSRATPPPPPISVEFVTTLAPTAPPVAAPPVQSSARPLAAAAPSKAASGAANEPADPASEADGMGSEAMAEPSSEGEGLLAEDQPVAAGGPAPGNPILGASSPTPEDVLQATAAPASAAASKPSAAPVAFDWPPSTRLVYSLTGQFRGPLHGSAQVEWLRQDQRYQVRLLVKVPPFFERRILSDGVIAADGLNPRRFDQETDQPLRETRRETLFFQAHEVTLPSGDRVPSEPGIQDSASQFVQLTWRFLTHPEELQAGRVVEFPLALPRRVGRWRFQVQPPETLSLPFGDIEAVHLKPLADNARAKELSMATWLAPTLQYLPVKIVLRLDDETYLELLLRDRPAQAAR